MHRIENKYYKNLENNVHKNDRYFQINNFKSNYNNICNNNNYNNDIIYIFFDNIIIHKMTDK